MGGVCSKYGERRGIYRCWWENLRERNHWDDPGADARITVRWILRKRDGKGMDLTDLAQDRDSWRDFVIAAMSLRIP
jgi:hypothetical protein